jgi:hypothetical protein
MPSYFHLCIENSKENEKLLTLLRIQKTIYNINLKDDSKTPKTEKAFFIDQDCFHKIRRAGFLVVKKVETDIDGIFFGELISKKEMRIKPKTKEPIRSFSPILKKAYVSSCIFRLDQQYKKNLKSIELAKVRLQAAQKTASENIQIIDSLEPMVYAAKKLADDSKTRFEKEFDALVSNPKILRLDIDKDANTFTVYTSTLYCTDPRSGIEHEIGRMKIIIHVDECYITFLNLSRHVDAFASQMEAPHVTEGGDACLGTLKSIVAELFGRHEYAALIHLCIQFIETVNINDDGGATIDNWPKSRRKASEQMADMPVKIEKSDIGKKTAMTLKKSIFDVLQLSPVIKKALEKNGIKTIGNLVSKNSSYLRTKISWSRKKFRTRFQVLKEIALSSDDRYKNVEKIKEELSKIGLKLRANEDGEE